MKVDQLHRLKEFLPRMSEDQKQKLLIGLRRMREDLGENPEGGNMLTTEDEFTGTGVTGVASNTEPKVIAKTFDTNSDFDSYVNQRRGIEMTPKELTAIGNYREARPTQGDRFFMRYETTDDFGNNSTTVIKKLKEGGQFCWTAFTKHESAEEEGGQGEKEKDLQEQEPSEDEMTVDDPIRITKSITFTDETQGADILANFLSSLDI
jgi:hypothetical protein